jgi:uncharacterized protein YjlB
MTETKTFYFERGDPIPNHPTLPMVVYKQVLPLDNDPTAACQRRFREHGWRGIWVNGVYSFQHYHSTSHEVLGVVAGQAEIQFGGEAGETLHVEAGDVVVLPAGTGHCNKGASSDFRVVGAYPAGQENWDLQRDKPDDHILQNIRRARMPEQDPVFGDDGPLLELWSE